MDDWRLGTIEARFADIIWHNEPLSTARLVELCAESLDWKRTTTYTVLKRLSERGIFKNEGGTVSSLVSREAFYGHQSRRFVEESFSGSLPAFLAAFSAHKPLTEAEVADIRRLLDGYKEG